MRKGAVMLAALCGALWCGPASAGSYTVDFDSNGQPSDYGCDVLGACLIPYSPEPFLTTSIVDAGGTHGNVLQATAGAGYNGDVYAGMPVPNSDQFYYLTSVDVYVTGPGNLYSGQDALNVTQGQWTTLTFSPGTQVLAEDFSLRSSPSWTPTGTVLFDNFQFETATNPNYVAPAPPYAPEPTTWAMMLLGFGAMGVSIRNRRGALITSR